jgi:hypothetical protein
MAKKEPQADAKVAPIAVEIGDIARQRKITVPSLDTGTYDYQHPNPKPEMVSEVPGIKDFEYLYWTNPWFFKAANLRANRIIGTGFKLQPAEGNGIVPGIAEKAVEDCERFLKKIDYVSFFKQSIINALVAGNEWTELVYNTQEPKQLISLAHGDFRTMDFRRDFLYNKILLDGSGNPVGFMQEIANLAQLWEAVGLMGGAISSYENMVAARDRWTQTRAIEIKNEAGEVVGAVTSKPLWMYLNKDEIVHLSFYNLNDNHWGTSMALPAYTPLVQLSIVMDASASAIKQFGYHKAVYTVGNEDVPATPNKLKTASNIVKNPTAKESFAIPWPDTLTYLEPGNSGSNVNDYPQQFITTAAVGMETPREVLTGEGESNRATAGINSTDYDRLCEAQRDNKFNRYASQIMGYFLGTIGYPTDDNGFCKYTPKIAFPQLTTEDKALKEKMAIDAWKNNGITFKEYREKLEMPVDEEDPRNLKYNDEIESAKASQTPTLVPGAVTSQVMNAVADGKGPEEGQMARHKLMNKDKLDPALNRLNKTEDVDYKKLAQTKMVKKIVSVSPSDALRIRDAIVNGEAKRKSAGQILQEIADIGGYDDEQARLVMYMEQRNLMENAKHENAKNKGMKFKKWVAHHDKATSALCKALDGKIVGIDEDFEVDYKEGGVARHWKGQVAPAHVNCRSNIEYMEGK